MINISDDQSELFDIVDENDHIVGKATRREVHKDKKLIHRSIGVVVFNSKGEMFLQQRSATKDTDPSKWTIACSGHVNRGDDYYITAIRELKEELGLNFIKSPISLVAQKKIDYNLRVLPLAYPSRSIHLALGCPRSRHPFINKDVGVKTALYLVIKPICKYICRAPKETEMVMLFKAISAGPFRLHPIEITQGKFFTQKELKEAMEKKELELSFMGKVALEKIGWIFPLDKKRQVG